MDTPTYVLDITTSIFSGVAMIWAGVLIVFDKRHATRYTLTMLSAACLLIAQIMDYVVVSTFADGILPSLSISFSTIARYLLWCIPYQVLHVCVASQQRTSLQSIITMIAYALSAAGSIIMIVYAIMKEADVFSINLTTLSQVGWYGCLPHTVGIYILSFSRDFQIAVRNFAYTFAAFIFLLTLINAGLLIEMISIPAGKVLYILFLSLTLIFVCACAPRWVSIKHDRLANQSDEEATLAEKPETSPDYRYDPDDVYTKEAHDIGRF